MFEEGISGRLMDISKSSQTSLGFKVWFPFVRSHMGTIREGSLVAAKNFSSGKDIEHYSVMRITSVMPTHYAMMASKDGYPGFVEEAAKSASRDWNQDRPVEDTTKIVCDAVPSGFEVTRPRSMDGGEPAIAPETSIPMQGEQARLLDTEWTGRIINHDLQSRDGTVALGTLANMSEVEIRVLWDSMIRTHFGVFAYTNAGKSNLLSTVTSKVFAGTGPVKAVIYDLMGEYGILLADVLYGSGNACVVFLSHDAVPASVLNFWRGPTAEKARVAARDIVRTTVLPKTLTARRESFFRPVQKMLTEGKFKMLLPDFQTITDMLQDIIDSADTSAASQAFRDFLVSNSGHECTVENIENLLPRLGGYDLGRALT